MRLPPKINHAIELGGILIPLAVDLTLCSICFASQAPDLLTRVAFVAIGIMIVLFIFLSWSRRFFVPWFIFVVVTVFFDYSFTLETTRLQSQEVMVQTAITDPELLRLQSLIDGSDTTLANLHDQYNKAMKRDTLDEINEQIKTENEKLTKYNADYKNRALIVEKDSKKAKISANDIINAIPRAWKDGRYIALVIWALIFIGVQLIVITSIDNKKIAEPVEIKMSTRRRKNIPEPLQEDDVSRFVKLNWYSPDTGTTSNIMQKDSFLDMIKTRGETFSKSTYNRIVSTAKKKKVIDNDGKILELNQTLAINHIMA